MTFCNSLIMTALYISIEIYVQTAFIINHILAAVGKFISSINVECSVERDFNHISFMVVGNGQCPFARNLY